MPCAPATSRSPAKRCSSTTSATEMGTLAMAKSRSRKRRRSFRRWSGTNPTRRAISLSQKGDETVSLPITGRRVRVGVLGAGRWAERAHLPGWARDPRAEIVAVCDVDRRLAEAAGKQFGAAVVSDDYVEIVNRDDLDVIDVCTPSHTHFELSLAALEAGKHVLCEKPVAFDFRETLRAAAFAAERGLKTKLG